ncbi:hypothetical protein QWY90_05795 [Flavobacterium paronense]|uniref:DUF4465 domain-containing protein n=1 Tax=Flavobacterium paronense TaxID=1392775 RepID=A0ABV5GB20_9FLAO|nr:hypothetical protein [Flavobacterium paronense]MDN3676823.1 hypothetical protein [Flavobacterium paronense]
MKRILCILTLLLIITACDDGNLTVDVIDFTDVAAQKCSDKDVIYKIKDAEMLFIEIPSTTFTSDVTLAGTPIEVPINSTNKVTYRKYASTVTANNICGSAPDVTPNLVEQWNATSGTIQITSTAVKSTNTTDNSTRITGYTYNIVFKNISFQKPTALQTYTTFPFGNYATTVSQLAFGFNHEVDKSACNNKIYDFSGGEVFTLDVEDYTTLFASEVTTTPRTALISTTNKLSYRLYSGTITDAYFCATTIPSSPTLTQQWNAIDGIEATSGIIEVTTTTLGSQHLHTIRLKKVTLKKGNSDFSLGDDYLFGTLITN